MKRGAQACSEDAIGCPAIGGHEMSSFAEAVQAILAIVVIGLAIQNGKLKREKELLFKQLCRMRDKEEGGNRNYLLCNRSKRLLKYQ